MGSGPGLGLGSGLRFEQRGGADQEARHAFTLNHCCSEEHALKKVHAPEDGGNPDKRSADVAAPVGSLTKQGEAQTCELQTW